MTKYLLNRLLAIVPTLTLLSACGGGGPGIDDESSSAGGQNVAYAWVQRTVPPFVTVEEGEEVPTAEDFKNFVAYREGSAAVYVGNDSERRRVTPSTGAYDIRQMSVSYDGELLLFSMRGPLVAPTEDEDDPVQPAWGLWEYDIADRQLVQLTEGNAETHIHDIDPVYLPDGRILFSSSRQQTAMAKLGDEGKVQYRHLTEDEDEEETDARTFNLHILGTGRDINFVKQVTFNQSHDFNPSMMDDGRVLFSRWDNNDADSVSIYRMNPDGSGVELLFGHNSPDVGLKVDADANLPIRYTRPRELSDGRVLVELKVDNEQAVPQVQFAALDVDNFIDEAVAVPGGAGTPVTLEYLGYTHTLPGVPNLDGRISAATPTNDGTGRFIVSWSICEIIIDGVSQVCTSSNVDDTSATEADPYYGLFIVDPSEGTQLPIVLPADNLYYTDIVIVREHDTPSYIAEAKDTGDPDLVDADKGVLHIRSVYNIDGVFNNGTADAATTLEDMKDPTIVPVADRPARYLRIMKHVPFWDEDTREIDDNFNTGTMGEILGYGEIEPDGSVMVEVPADIPFSFSIVDGDGVRIEDNDRHTNWVQLRPGETLTCNGCHTENAEVAHGRAGEADTINTGAPSDGAYPNTDPAMTALLGETMAETRARLDPTSVQLSSDIVFTDVWGEPGSKAPDVSLTYADLVASFEDVGVSYLPPVNFSSCVDEWAANCRIVINYETNIHPLWSKPREVLGPDPDVVENPPTIVLEDYTCTSCHNHEVADGDIVRTGGNANEEIFPTPLEAPVQQLYLGDNEGVEAALSFVTNGDRYEAYDFLTADRHIRGIVDGDGALVKHLAGGVAYVEVPVLDDDGNPVLDDNGDAVLTCEESTDEDDTLLALTRSMVRNSARARTHSMVAPNRDVCEEFYPDEPNQAYYTDSDETERSFFTKMEDDPLVVEEGTTYGAFDNETDHRGWLTDVELKLLREWIDMGGHYFNNPFDAPSD